MCCFDIIKGVSVRQIQNIPISYCLRGEYWTLTKTESCVVV